MKEKQFAIEQIQRKAGTHWQMTKSMKDIIISQHGFFYLVVIVLLVELLVIVYKSGQMNSTWLFLLAIWIPLFIYATWLYKSIRSSYEMLLIALMIAGEKISEWNFVCIRNDFLILSDERPWRINFSIQPLEKRIEKNIQDLKKRQGEDSQ